MNENEIYEDQYDEEIEAEETDEETTSSKNGFIGVLIGAAIGVGGCAAYKYIVKPIKNKIKSRKKTEVVEAVDEDGETYQADEEE